VRDGGVRVPDDCTAVVLKLPPARAAAPAPHADRLADRVAAHLAASGGTTIAELETRLGLSRTSLQLALRMLLASGRVERTGRARATRYQVAARSAPGDSGRARGPVS
jgi:hypothetical protein